MSIRKQRFSVLKQPLFSTLNQHLIDYPTPSNISYWWGFGSLAGICLVIQIVTGVFLAMHYTPHVDLAFNSVEHIMRDVEGGWLLRYMHANGASIFLILISFLIEKVQSFSFFFEIGLVFSFKLKVKIVSLSRRRIPPVVLKTAL